MMLFCMVLFWLGLFFLLQGDMYGSSLHPAVFDSKTLLCIMIGADNVSIRLVLFFVGGVLLDYGFCQIAVAL